MKKNKKIHNLWYLNKIKRMVFKKLWKAVYLVNNCMLWVSIYNNIFLGIIEYENSGYGIINKRWSFLYDLFVH